MGVQHGAEPVRVRQRAGRHATQLGKRRGQWKGACAAHSTNLMDVLSACETLATSSAPYFTHSSHDGRLYEFKYLDHEANITS